ncbi:hypothetical protein J2128_002561 [Methanomicrobium sp. W14]|nr:hypothetical protein [Methanomicrobium sp. W14]MBP2134590.1 hypothetical protein [Methanomicrobium sp. W14]
MANDDKCNKTSSPPPPSPKSWGKGDPDLRVKRELGEDNKNHCDN